jgi:hypothetical protein
MNGIWNVLATITLAGATIAAIEQKYVPLHIGIAGIYLIVLWAINMTIDLNSWHVRNLIFLAAIEREFLASSDYGRLLPKAYRTPATGWITYFSLNLLAFLILLGMCITYAYGKGGCGQALTLNILGIAYYWWLLGTGLLYTGLHWWGECRSANKHRSELFG